jgi:hypothetical protein
LILKNSISASNNLLRSPIAASRAHSILVYPSGMPRLSLRGSLHLRCS